MDPSYADDTERKMEESLKVQARCREDKVIQLLHILVANFYGNLVAQISCTGATPNLKARSFLSYLERLQFEYFNGRPEWITIELKNLKLYMAYTYFGSPNITDNAIDDTDIFEFYKDDEKEYITDMFKVIKTKVIEKCENIEVGVTMIHSICKSKCTLCENSEELFAHVWYLLRIKKRSNVAYIDLCRKRTYKNFNDYIENNILPAGFMYYPEIGMYNEKKYLVSKLTPASVSSNLKCLDKLVDKFNFCASGIIALNMISPLAPLLSTSAAIVTVSACTYDVCRQSSTLSNFVKHNRSVISREATEHWLNLASSVLGIITAPISAVENCITSNGVKFLGIAEGGKLLSNLSKVSKGAYIAQFSLEFIRCTLNVINEGNCITLKNLIKLRLDMLVVIGSLIPMDHVRKILQVMTFVTLEYGDVLIREIPNLSYCLGQYIMRAVCFVRKHIEVFIHQLWKFVSKELTVDKMLCAWKAFRRFMDEYREQTNKLRGPQLLHHIVHDLMTLPCDEQVKQVLCGDEMAKLIEELQADNDRRVIEFCLRRVMGIASQMRAKYRDSVAVLTDLGFTNSDEIDAEFCRTYGLTVCRFDQFVLHGIRQVAADGPDAFGRAYNNEPWSFSENIHVAGHRTGTRSLETFNCIAPPQESMSKDFCQQFASVVDPTNTVEYNGSEHLLLSDGTSVLFTANAFSLRIVLFHVDSFNGRSPSLNVSVFSEANGDGRRLRFD